MVSVKIYQVKNSKGQSMSKPFYPIAVYYFGCFLLHFTDIFGQVKDNFCTFLDDHYCTSAVFQVSCVIKTV